LYTEDAALKTVCKIHRKLPLGGILVFLTGKQEIERMASRLREILRVKQRGREQSTVDAHLLPSAQDQDTTAPRDLDDEENDGDFFLERDNDDYENMVENEEADTIANTSSSEDAPLEALILPLYALLAESQQAKVFQPVPEGQRLIVLATNIAETSITIPGISYVVDTGRQKCRNYSAGTGVASFDIMWISKAAADQRAGRAGRTGPGHCYRLYSSSMYARHMDDFALPEVLTRPLEDIVLAMKAMNISSVSKFPFPTPPDSKSIDAAMKLLANIGCLDVSTATVDGTDGQITRLGSAIAQLPLGVRYGKMLLVSAQAGLLDYGIAMVAALSEESPFISSGQQKPSEPDPDGEAQSTIQGSDELEKVVHPKARRWFHKGGDVLAKLLAVGAYSYAGRGAGGAAEELAYKRFCAENGLNDVIMRRIQKMRIHLARLSKAKLSDNKGIASKTGGLDCSLRPPNKLEEKLLAQSIASGLLDNVAMLAPVGSISGNFTFDVRTAYISCSMQSMQPLLIERNSVLHTNNFRQLPQWVCYESLLRKTLANGYSVAVMKNVTPIDPAWLGIIAKGSKLSSTGAPLPSPLPKYDKDADAIVCCVETRFGVHHWEIPPIREDMSLALGSYDAKKVTSHFLPGDNYRWFARFLLEGEIIKGLKGFDSLLNDSPSILCHKSFSSKVVALVTALASNGINSAHDLKKHWAQVDDKFLFKCLKAWVKKDNEEKAKNMWISAVKESVREFKSASC
jgi:ATP-dependent RNA helicase DHX37/DHR1